MDVSQLVMIVDAITKTFWNKRQDTPFSGQVLASFLPIECLFDLLYFFLSFGCVLNHIKNGPEEQRNET